MAGFQVSVRVAELEVEQVRVDIGELVLIGRKGARFDLDPDELRLVPDALRGRLRRVEVESEYVSRKHCLLWVEDGQLRVRDLYSAQGTQVGIAGAETLSTTAERIDVSLVPASRAGLTQPDPIDLSKVRGEQDYADTLTRNVREWARVTGVQIDVDVEARDGQLGRTEDSLRLRLGGARALVVARGHHTARVSFDLARDALARYVASQNAQFAAVQQGVQRAAAAQPMVAMSASMQAACWQIAQCATNDLRVILLGETGVGKTLMARRYHEAAGGAEFVTIDCTQYDDVTRLRAELFGAEPGAWTGLTRRYVGAFERARDGSVFIDEIGELAPENQKQLLTFLDRGRFTRVLGTDELESNARILCGTRQDLGRAVREGRFREDLWYRLAGMVITIPPLRERPEDIEELLSCRMVAVDGRERPATRVLTADAMRFLTRYAWPGNARELEMFCKRLPVFLKGREEADAALCDEVLRAGNPSSPTEGRAPGTSTTPSATVEPSTESWRPTVVFDEGRPDELAHVSWDGVIEAALRDYGLTRGIATTDAQALRALFTVDDTGGESTVGVFKEFVDRHLKPRFIARATGLEGHRGLPVGFTAEHWKHALGFGDGTSIKQLLRVCFVLERRRKVREALERRGAAAGALLRRIGSEDNLDTLDRWIARIERGEPVFDNAQSE